MSHFCCLSPSWLLQRQTMPSSVVKHKNFRHATVGFIHHSMPRLKWQHMHWQLGPDPDLSQSAQGDMSVSINAAHVRLGTNRTHGDPKSLALLVLQKVWYYSARSQLWRTGALCYKEDFFSQAQPTHLQKCYKSWSLKLWAELSNYFSCFYSKNRSNLHQQETNKLWQRHISVPLKREKKKRKKEPFSKRQ